MNRSGMTAVSVKMESQKPFGCSANIAVSLRTLSRSAPDDPYYPPILSSPIHSWVSAMSKPANCPNRVWDEAGDLADELHELDDYMHLESRKVIARAIMAAEKRGEEREREACLAAIRSLHADAWGITEEQSALDDAIAALERRGAVVAAIRNCGAEQ